MTIIIIFKCMRFLSERSTVLCCQLPTDSITSVLSRVFKRLVSVRFEGFVNRSCVCRNVCVPVMHFFVAHALQSALESGQGARIV